MTTVAIIQARMGSSRLPGKTLADLGGRPVLGWVMRAAQAIPGVDAVTVATSVERADDPVAARCAEAGVECYRGPLDDVLARFDGAAREAGAETVIRLTADCPLLDPEVCGQVLQLYRRSGADLATNADTGTWPDGLDCEVLSAAALATAAREASRAADREHVTPFILANRHRFAIRSLACPLPGLGDERWTLDTAADLDFLRPLAAALPAGRPPSLAAVLAALDADPGLRARRPAAARNARFPGSAGTADGRRDFAASQALLARARRTVPLGTQTFSKAAEQYPADRAPHFLSHGRGGRVWDVDGNEYVDLVSALLPVVLGYCDADVDAAIRDQLGRGIAFSLATRLECELAERLVDLVPCAEQVRFGKNGTDATSAAVRLARAYTGRDHVVACGYHGWQDWYIGATARHKGVPGAVRALTHMVPYNDLPALEAAFAAHDGAIAAVVMEPITFAPPAEGYLAAVQALAHRHGALLVFDEIITGFRFAAGGAQALFGVTPDLACFGKAMANGMPISAVLGRAEVMAEMSEIFFSGTFGGEALSLAAAIAVIDKMAREPVIEALWETGAALGEETRALVRRHGLAEVLSVKGLAPWLVLDVADHVSARKEAIRTLLIREMIAAGVLFQGTHNVSYAHTEADRDVVAAAYDRAFATVAAELATGALEDRLGHPAIEPVFRVRGGKPT